MIVTTLPIKIAQRINGGSKRTRGCMMCALVNLDNICTPFCHHSIFAMTIIVMARPIASKANCPSTTYK